MSEFKELYKELRRPFTPAAVRFKPQATWGDGGQIVAFIDARLAAGRLNAICPGEWESDIQPSGNGAVCRLTVGGLTRTDFGVNEGFENAKASYSDAFKRAAVHFGVGESLYYLPRLVLNVGNGLRDTGRKDKRGKPVLAMTPQGPKICRQTYTDWLKTVGEDLFGKPYDHGDQLADDEGQTSTQFLGELIGEADFSPDQVDAIREFIKNGNGPDPQKVAKAIALLQAGEPEVLLERAGA